VDGINSIFLLVSSGIRFVVGSSVESNFDLTRIRNGGVGDECTVVVICCVLVIARRVFIKSNIDLSLGEINQFLFGINID
jgi:hypothetical protein